MNRKARTKHERREPITKPSHLASQSTTMSGMTQEMEALAFEGDEGVELTDEEAEASAREYDAAQVPAN